MTASPSPVRLLTVGHGTVSSEELEARLRRAGIEAVVDVRRYPGSRRHPQFNRESLARSLPRAGIRYRWEEALGGRRSGQPHSPHTALRNASFRAYADHMSSTAWREGLSGVLDDARRGAVAVMCSESLWWRCHRRLIADVATLVHAAEVGHLLHDDRFVPHPVTDGARRSGDRVVYDAGTLPIAPSQDVVADQRNPGGG